MKKSFTKQTALIFWRHMRKYPWVFFILMLTTILGSIALSVIPPLYYKQLIDVIAGSDRTSPEVQGHIVSIVLHLFGMYIIAFIAWTIATFADNFFSTRVSTDLANTSFEYIHKHSHGFFVKGFVGSIIRKMNRFTTAYERIHARSLWSLIPTIVEVFAIFSVLTIRNNLLGIVLFIWGLIYLTAMYFFSIYKMKFDRVAASADSDVAARTADTITNNVNIKLFASLGREMNSFRNLNESQFKLQKRALDIDAIIERSQAVLMLAVEIAMIFAAVKLWREGKLSVGDFALIQSYLGVLFYRLWDVGRVTRDVYTQLADAQEMTEILETPHEVKDAPGAKELAVSRGAVEYRDMSFTYAQTREVMKDFNLSIAPGEKVGLVGPSGAGKSTLVSLLFRFYDLAGGHIVIDGQDIAHVTQDSLRRQISLVPQDPILFHRTLMENIRYGKADATDEEVMQAARLAHCDEFIKRMPEKYETYVGERGVKLSGGERQRVAIARAILKNAPILVLDEATSSLDSSSEAVIQDALNALMRGKTVIVIAHRLSTIMKMDRIVVVEDGKIVESGAHADLIKKDAGLYKQLWNLQAGGFISE